MTCDALSPVVVFMKRKSDVSLPECIVCDIGSSSVKAGTAADALPSTIYPTLVGRPVVHDRSRQFEPSDENLLDEYVVLRPRSRGEDKKPSMFKSRDVLVGLEAKEKQAQLDVSKPVESGIVKNWDDLELLLDRVFSALRTQEDNILTPSNKQRRKREAVGGSIVLSDIVDAPSAQRERFCEIFFESFSFDRINVSPAAALTLTARGATTGLVVDCGDSKTEIVPVFSGFVQKTGVRKSPLGGAAVIRRLSDLLKRSESCNYRLDLDRDYSRLQPVVEQLVYVATQLEEERQVAETTNVLARTFELPDRTKIVMNSERFLAAEVLFNSDVSGDRLGIVDLAKDAIAACPMDVKPAMLKSVILSGGCSVMTGFSSRFRAGLGDMGQCWVDEAPERQFSPFIGGAAMAATNEHDSEWWISRNEFQETGAAGVIKRLLGPKSFRI